MPARRVLNISAPLAAITISTSSLRQRASAPANTGERERERERERDLGQEGSSLNQAVIGSHFSVASALQLLPQRLLIQARRRGGERGGRGSSESSLCRQQAVLQGKLVLGHHLKLAFHLAYALKQLCFPCILASLPSLLVTPCVPQLTIPKPSLHVRTHERCIMHEEAGACEVQAGGVGKRAPKTIS